VKTAVTGATLLSKGAVFQNENFRIGGNALMRGFNEASIFATSYLVGTVELRYLTAQNSYFYLFGDYGMIENKSTNNSQNQYLGVGAGITFDTAIGIFGISAAIGKQDANSFDFKSTKIHFGYVNLF
jgi:hemolysin activation/secretion protein